MKEIPLTQGKVALVDDEDFEKLNKYKWYAHKENGKIWYARRNDCIDGKQKTILMHQQIMNFEYKILDHKNHNGLDNQKSNLRQCTNSQNCQNSVCRTNNVSSKILGVHWNDHSKKWLAHICKDYKQIHIGQFDSKEEAAFAREKAEKELFGEFAPERKI